ncbi:MAG: MarR family transcriptional regulator [Clostridiales bacterium]|nr:MarR family transcriptional regulator [Clostridiales bacterium]
MEYLNHVLGIRVMYKDDKIGSMPNFIHARYRMQVVALDGKEAIFLYPKTELDAVSAIRKQIDRIQRTAGMPVVLVPEYLTYRQKEYLLREQIPFIVDGKQIYLPFMAVYLQERCNGERPVVEAMLPSAQLLLLYYIYHGCGEMLTSEAADKLRFTPTSVSRASRQLEEMDLLRTEKRGVQKVIFSEKKPEEMFAAAKDYFRNPVKRVIYVPKAEIKENLLLSGYHALSEYSMLNPPSVTALAADSIAKWEGVSSKQLQSSEDQCALEFWRYDPKKLSDGAYVDKLSLAISLREDRDERIEEAVEEMLTQVWRDIDGKRD